MTRQVSIHPDATAEVTAAAVWYDERRTGLGLQFLAAVDRTLERVREWPESGSSVPGLTADIEARRMPVARFPYHIVFLLHADRIHVLAVAHDHRRPGYWTDRGGSLGK